MKLLSFAEPKTVFLSGPEAKKVYVYYPRPLKHLRDGERFVLSLSSKPTRLVSPLTGEEWNTKDNGYVLLYKRRVIGACDYLGEELKSIERTGIEIQIDAMKNGWYVERKIPNITAFWPSHEEMKKWIRAQKLLRRALPFPAEIIKFNTTFEKGDIVPNKQVSDITLKMMPVPKGSSAKPHIGFWSGSRFLFDVDAKSDAYKQLLPLVDNITRMFIEKRKSTINKGEYIHIEYIQGPIDEMAQSMKVH